MPPPPRAVAPAMRGDQTVRPSTCAHVGSGANAVRPAQAGTALGSIHQRGPKWGGQRGTRSPTTPAHFHIQPQATKSPKLSPPITQAACVAVYPSIPHSVAGGATLCCRTASACHPLHLVPRTWIAARHSAAAARASRASSAQPCHNSTPRTEVCPAVPLVHARECGALFLSVVCVETPPLPQPPTPAAAATAARGNHAARRKLP
jgi:hypothetical protein